MQRNDISALLAALAVSAAMVAGIIYFVRVLWPILPGWIAMIIFIFIAVAVIGYPIYALARWSDRYFPRSKPGSGKSVKKDDDADDS